MLQIVAVKNWFNKVWNFQNKRISTCQTMNLKYLLRMWLIFMSSIKPLYQQLSTKQILKFNPKCIVLIHFNGIICTILRVLFSSSILPVYGTSECFPDLFHTRISSSYMHNNITFAIFGMFCILFLDTICHFSGMFIVCLCTL